MLVWLNKEENKVINVDTRHVFKNTDRVWITNDGREIPIKDLEDRHLVSIKRCMHNGKIRNQWLLSLEPFIDEEMNARTAEEYKKGNYVWS